LRPPSAISGDLPSRTLGVDEKIILSRQYVIFAKAKKVIPSLREAVKNVDKV